MFFKENIKIAFSSIKTNKIRAFLTMLGIIIGIASVIIIISLGNGGRTLMLGQFNNIGASTIVISVNGAESQSDRINDKDIDAIRNSVANVKYISPYLTANVDINEGEKRHNAIIVGGTTDITTIFSLELVSGRYFTETEYELASKVILVDDNFACRVFGSTDIDGCVLNVNNDRFKGIFKIIGVYKSTYGEFADDLIPAMCYIPSSTFRIARGGEPNYGTIYIMSDDREYTDTMGYSVINLLESRHLSAGRNLYRPENLIKQLDQINNALAIFTAFIVAVAAISLLVGGIGVMNIMLVSVTERTKEIGIRKSLGAKYSSIMFQFLMESAILTLIGGILGVLFGGGGALLIGRLLKLTPIFDLQSILLSLLFSSAVGIFFGIYPARKAAKLSPIDALRHE